MRAIVLLCMLHAASVQSQFLWETAPPISATEPYVCFKNQESCGCCLMQKQVQRMEAYFNESYEEMNEVLTKSKTALNNMRGYPEYMAKYNRSAFSVVLNNISSFGPFNVNTLIVYKQVLLNMGDDYNAESGIFTTPHSGVYSLALTVYSHASSCNNALPACADLQVNGQVVAALPQQKGEDLEDSATVVVAVELKAGDKVAVNLPIGCQICDNNSRFNTFTGFLLYPSD